MLLSVHGIAVNSLKNCIPVTNIFVNLRKFAKPFLVNGLYLNKCKQILECKNPQMLFQKVFIQILIYKT